MSNGDIPSKAVWIIGGILTIVLAIFAIINIPLRHDTYDSSYQTSATITIPTPFVVTHIPTPDPLKAIYMTSWVGGNEKLRNNLVKIIEDTEINAVVIDIKDHTGRIAFSVEDPKLKSIGSSERRIPDIKEFIETLHDKGIYVIGRISVFQDSFLVNKYPEHAVKTKAGKIWKDSKGVSWLDAGSRYVWDYVVDIARESYSLGFDEINFDYIRFPSDGNMEDISYPYSQGKVKREVLKSFFKYVDEIFHKERITISADFFGMTTSNSDDLGISQIIEDALAHFDYVSPMVYPSHYPPNFNGWKNPAEKPYDVVLYAMQKAYNRALIASTTPSKLRPWLQDFSINGTLYTADMVKDQIRATYDSGLTSWMMWNASNKYTLSAYEVTED